MKTKKTLLTVAVMMMGAWLLTCSRPTAPDLDNPYDREGDGFIETADLSTREVTGIQAYSAVSGGEFETRYGLPATAKGVCWSMEQGPTIDDQCTNEGEGNNSFESQLTGLQLDQAYYVRAYATNEAGTIYGGERTFTTRDGIAVLATHPAREVTPFSAKVGGEVQDDGGSALINWGICYAEDPDPDISDICISANEDYEGQSRFEGEQLAGERILDHAPMESEAPQRSFDQKAEKDAGNRNPPGHFSPGPFQGGFFDGSDAGVEPSSSRNTSPTGSKRGEMKVELASESVEFVLDVTGLSPDRTYYVRSFAVNQAGTFYGSQVNFTTADGLPSVSTTIPVDITPISARAGGEVVEYSGKPVTGRGVCYGTEQNPGLPDGCIAEGQGPGSFEVLLEDLQPDQTYYVRAYATTDAGNSYGQQESFTTPDGLPIVTTSDPFDATAQTMKVGGEIIDEGDAPISELGICYAAHSDPTREDNCISVDEQSSFFVVKLTELDPDLVYFARAYAVNMFGTGYGENREFTTDTDLCEALGDCSRDVMPGGDAKWFAQADVVFDGETALRSGAIATNRQSWVETTIMGPGTLRFWWKVSSRANNHFLRVTINGNPVHSISGEVDWQMREIQIPEDSHIIRWTYQKNNQSAAGQDAGWLDKLEFEDAGTATVITSDVTLVTAVSAVYHGEVVSEGVAPVTERGFCYGTAANPNLSGTCVETGAGPGRIEYEATGLSPNTTYHVRAYARSSAGVSYGANRSFTTLTGIPQLTATVLESVTNTSAVISGSVEDDNGSAILERGACYGTSPNPTRSGSCVTTGGTLGEFSLDLLGLFSATSYYARTFATTDIGTGYGEQVSFSTTYFREGAGVSDVDGHAYPTVIIGEQHWMAENLRSGRYANGDDIAHITGNADWTQAETGGWSNYENEPANDEHYGKLYNWYAASDGRNVCPDGWHVPTEDQWVELEEFLGGQAGGKIKSTDSQLWRDPNRDASNVSGLTGLPAGRRSTNGVFSSLGEYAGWWTITDAGNGNARFRDVNYLSGALNSGSFDKRAGFSVRCIEGTEPDVTITQISNIRAFSAAASGQVVAAGSLPVIDRGVCYATSPAPGSSDHCISAGSGTGVFDVDLTGLQKETTYFVRAYAANVVSVTFSNEQSFTTRDGIPVLTTTEPFDIRGTSARTGGEISDDGGADITARGVCYVEGSGEPGLSDTCLESGNGTGSFEVLLEDIDHDQQYTVRAYATTDAGTGWGQEREFKTLAEGDVFNPATGRIWMDRNLGASRAATSSTDSLAYGDLYQWGRAADGHQRRNSSTTSTLSSSDQPGHGSFILSTSEANWDWRSPQNDDLWQGVNGTNNPCPAGYRLPTSAEWDAERNSWSSNNASGAFGSPLKLPLAGHRYFSSGSLFVVGSFGHYWSGAVSGSGARVLHFGSSGADVLSFNRAGGRSVRCLKDE